MLSLNTGLYQQQNITTHMVMSMNILQMSSTELEAYLEKLSLENPVIELSEPEQEAVSEKEIELQRKLEWLESTDRQNQIYYTSDRDDEDPESRWKDPKSTEADLVDYLWAQVILNDYSEKEFYVAGYIIRSLDSRGYFTEDPDQVAELLGTTNQMVLDLLSDIQTLDPAGIGARDLKECLLLQMERNHIKSKLMERLISHHLEEIARNHLEKIAKAEKVSVDEVAEACSQIRKLDPKPGSRFSDRSHLHYISPDVYIVKLEDHLEVLVNEYSYPRFDVSAFYRHMERTTDDEETKKYLHEKIQEAKNVADGIKQRAGNLSLIAGVIAEWQEEFFRFGPGNKKPMRLKDIAMEVQMHESTISRTLRSKYLQCAWGVYPLNYFLTSVAAVSEDTGAEQTVEFVKEKLKAVVDAEDKKKPLSDEAIRKQLIERFGVDIARRTVNKYRQEMGILDKAGRRVSAT